jgi:hypothetical protein
MCMTLRLKETGFRGIDWREGCRLWAFLGRIGNRPKLLKWSYYQHAAQDVTQHEGLWVDWCT